MSATRQQKNLTVMFTDISGFTKHTETISREDLMSRLDTHNELLMPIVAHFDGKIVKTIGDAFLITFESPTNAVQCGLFMQHTLRKYNTEKPIESQIHIKVSINSGEVTVTDTDVFGDPVNVAAKIEKATNPDEIYFTESVFLAMNKAEVPTSFVKNFRPKGVDSTEIKLYKVAMDEGDERYQKIISGTTIDKEKMKTRVLELSNLAEKEFTRYQDTLEVLVEKQSSNSRTVVIAVLAGALILAAAIIVGFVAFGGSAKDNPSEQLAKDVRSYLQTDKPVEARSRIESYINEHGADDTTDQLIKEIETFEIEEVVTEARRLIGVGKPEDARTALKAFFGEKEYPADAAAADLKAANYIGARTAIEKGDSEAAIAKLSEAFGDTNPSEEIRVLRDKAGALERAAKLYEGKERYTEPLLMLGAIVKGFGEDTQNEHALKFIEEGLANEMFRYARDNGFDSAQTQYESYRQRFPHVRSWNWIQAHMKMGGCWNYRMEHHSSYSHSEAYWGPWRAVSAYVDDKPEKKYRFGCFNFMLARKQWLATCDGAKQWQEAIEADKELIERHKDFMDIYRVVLGDSLAELGKDLKTDLAYLMGCYHGNLLSVRTLIRDLYYDDLKRQMIEWVNTTDEDLETEQMNSFAILAEKGDIAVVQDPFGLFRMQFGNIMDSRSYFEQYHVKALFQLEMTYDDYKEFRNLIDTTLADVREKKGRWGSYTHAIEHTQTLQKDLKEAQPLHTAQYDG